MGRVKNKKRTLGIRGQLIGGIVVLAVAATSLIGILSLKVLEQKLLESRVSEAMILADFFRVGGSVGSSAMQDTARYLVRNGRLDDIELLGPKGEVLFTEGAPPDMRDGNTLMISEGVSVKHRGWKRFGPVHGELTVQVRPRGGGLAKFVVPLTNIRNELSSIKKFILYYTVIDTLIITAIGFYFLSVLVIRPIRSLEATAGRIAGGDLAVRVDLQKSGEEIASLSDSFNAMADSVEEKIKRIEAVNRNLIETQERLIITEKLATVGRLGAGIAHEIGNPLGAIQGYLDILVNNPSSIDKEEAEEILSRMEKEISRINSIVQNFLNLSREGEATDGTCDVNRVAGESVLFLKGHKDFIGVDTSFDFAGGLPEARIATDKLKQVFINLLLNAASAMGGAGRVDVKSFLRDSGGEERECGGGKIVISFTDTGPGIAAEEKSKVFDPFYTTKEPGDGTGLGLFISDGILSAYGGEINVIDGDGGVGVTFEVVLEAVKR